MKRILLIHLDTSSIEAVIAVLLIASVCSCGQTEVSLIPQQTAIGFVPSDAASSRAVVTDVMALADGIKSQQQLYHPLLMLPQLGTFGIEPGSQLLITILSCLIFHHIHLFFL